MILVNHAFDHQKINSIFRKIELKQKVSEKEFLEAINYLISVNKAHQAIVLTARALEYFPDSFDIKLTEAQVFIESKMYTIAYKKLKRLYITAKDDISLLLLIAVFYAKQNKTKKSKFFFNKAIKLVNYQQDAFIYNISQILIDLESYRLALYFLNKAYNINSKDEDILCDIAYCYEKLGKKTKAKQVYSKILKQNPLSSINWFNYGVMLMNTDKQKALECFDYAIALNPDYSSPYFNKAMLLLNSKDYYKSIESLNKFLEKEQQNTSAFFYRGLAYYHTHNYKQAIVDFSLSIKNPTDAKVYYLLAKSYFKIKKIEEAKHFIQKAIELDDKNYKYFKFANKLVKKI